MLKISGVPICSAASSASKQKLLSIVFDSRHASTWRLAQSMMATRYGRIPDFPGHALTPTGVMAIRCKQFHLPDL